MEDKFQFTVASCVTARDMKFLSWRTGGDSKIEADVHSTKSQLILLAPVSKHFLASVRTKL